MSPKIDTLFNEYRQWNERMAKDIEELKKTQMDIKLDIRDLKTKSGSFAFLGSTIGTLLAVLALYLVEKMKHGS